MNDWVKFVYLAHFRHKLRLDEFELIYYDVGSVYKYKTANLIIKRAGYNNIKIQLGSKFIIREINKYLMNKRYKRKITYSG